MMIGYMYTYVCEELSYSVALTGGHTDCSGVTHTQSHGAPCADRSSAC